MVLITYGQLIKIGPERTEKNASVHLISRIPEVEGLGKALREMGYKMKKSDMQWLHSLKEFKLQAEKHLCSIPVIEQTYIYTEGHLLIFH